MSTHPLPPDTLAERIAAWHQSMQAVVDLGFTCRDADFALDTDCPGWTIKDQFAHIAGMEAMLAGVRGRKIDVPDYPHLRHDTARVVEEAVEVRRGATGPQVVAEIQRLLPNRLTALSSIKDPDEVIDGLFGPSTALDLVTMRAVDVWCHEQDIRVALDRPGNLDSPSAALFVSTILDAFPRLAARRANLPVGTVVILDSTGPVTARAGVRIVAGEDRPYGESLFSGESDPGWREGPVTSIRLSTASLARLGAGRRPADEVSYIVEGDEDVARSLLNSLAVTP